MKSGSATTRESYASNRTNAATSLAGRASAKAPSGTQPQSVATGDVWAHFRRPSLSAATLADRREVIGVIEHAIREGGTHLDFHNVSAAALKAVPGAAVKALARQVTAVVLPARLDALPRCLNRLKALRSIEMAECTARQIDVTRRDLDTLTVTGRTELRWIAANEDTRVSCPAPGIRRKVCVNVYRDGRLLGHTAAGSRCYLKAPTTRETNINGRHKMRNGQLAFCQSITKWWFGARQARHSDKRRGALDPASDMYAVLKDRCSFKGAVTEDMGRQYDELLTSATRNIMVGNDRFGEVIEREFRRMRRGGTPAKKHFQANSTTHAMGLELKIKNGRNGKPEYSLVFYDPNVSTTHVRIKYHLPREARDLTFTGLFPRSDFIAEYFNDHAPVVTLVDLDSVQPGGKRSLRMMLSEKEMRSELTLNLAIRDGFDVAAQELIGALRTMAEGPVDWKAILLSLSSLKDLPLFIVARDAGRPRLAGVLAELAIVLIAEGALERTPLFQLLEQQDLIDEVGYTALGVACDANDREFIDQLIDVLVKPDADGLASAAEYESLLANGGTGLPSPYAHAIQGGHIGAALSMVEGMLRLRDANRITRDQFVRLLASHDNNGVPAIEKAFNEGNADLMLALMQPLTSTATVTFSDQQLIAMLSAARSDGTPALRATYQAGHAEFLAAYGKLVLSAVSRGRILPLDAIVLLMASMPEETPCEALLAMAPGGDVLRTLDDLLHDVRVARWLPADLSEALDALLAEDPADPLSSDFDTDSESSSLG